MAEALQKANSIFTAIGAWLPDQCDGPAEHSIEWAAGLGYEMTMQDQNHEVTLARLAFEAFRRLFADEAIPLAGNIAFRTLFSIFPFLIFLTTLAGFLGNEQLATRIVDFLFEVAPKQLVDTLSPEIHSILTVPRTGLLSLSVLLTIWSAMGGVDSVRVALNRAYDIKDTRSFLRTYGLGIVFVVGSAAILLTVAALLVFMPVILTSVDRISPGFSSNFTLLDILRIPIAILLMLFGLLAAHRFLPARKQRLRDLLPGVVITIFVWLLLALAFSTYLLKFNTFASTYASLSGLFAAMFFLYLSALVLILGGEFNRVLQIHRKGPHDG